MEKLKTIEEIFIEYLSSSLFVPATAERDIMNGEYLVVEKTGGSGESLKRATIAVQSYAPSMYEASVLNENVKAVMREAANNISVISRVELNSDYNFTDTTTKGYRYQAVFDIIYI